MYVHRAAERRHGSCARGFTLVELVVGITLIAIVAALLVNLVYPAWRQSAEPLVQQRAAALAQSLMEEILSKRFDELTPDGGVPPCTPCSSSLGSDGETRASFDDVDDYNDYCASSVAVTDADGSSLSGYDSYRMRICVSYDGNYDGVDDTDQAAKRITVTITPGSLAPIVFSAYRANF